MTTIILHVDLSLNGDSMDTGMSNRLSDERASIIAKKQPAQLTALNSYLSRGFTAIFTGQTVYEGDHRRTDKAVFILYKADGQNKESLS
jgi:pSer/pThr/pTyr-binding forkhead associated (FHA) protein